MPREKSCGAVVFKKNTTILYLLLHYASGHWDFVKGQVEANESEKETVMRELKEETGIEGADFVGDFREEINYFYRRRDTTIFKKVTYFLVQSHTSEVELSYEHVAYVWLNYRKAIERLTFKNARNVLKKAHTFLKSVESVGQT